MPELIDVLNAWETARAHKAWQNYMRRSVAMADKSKCVGGSYGWVIVVVTMLAGFVPASNMAKVTALAPVVMQTFGFDAGTLGWVIALFYVMGLVMAFPTTAFINKMGIKGAVVIAVACGVVGSIMGAVCGTNVGLFMFSRVLEGAGFGVMGVAGSSAIGPWFTPEKRSVPLSIWSMWVALCMCVCPILYGWQVDTLGMPWTSVWWGATIYDLIAGIIFVIAYRAPADLTVDEADEAAKAASKASYSRAYKSKMLWALALIFLFDEAAFMAINGFLTTYLTDPTGVGATLVAATAISSLFGLAGAIAPPISGAICQKWNCHRWVLLFALIVGVIYTALVFSLHTYELYYGMAILAGIVGGFVPSILWQFTPNTVQTEDIPAANSLMAFTQNVGMLIGAVVIGNAVNMWGWSMGSWIGMVPLYIICLIIYFAFGLQKHLKL